jgi:hypothetical protein
MLAVAPGNPMTHLDEHSLVDWPEHVVAFLQLYMALTLHHLVEQEARCHHSASWHALASELRPLTITLT